MNNGCVTPNHAKAAGTITLTDSWEQIISFTASSSGLASVCRH